MEKSQRVCWHVPSGIDIDMLSGLMRMHLWRSCRTARTPAGLGAWMGDQLTRPLLPSSLALEKRGTQGCRVLLFQEMRKPITSQAIPDDAVSGPALEPAAADAQPPARKRGRPPKSAAPVTSEAGPEAAQPKKTTRKKEQPSVGEGGVSSDAPTVQAQRTRRTKKAGAELTDDAQEAPASRDVEEPQKAVRRTRKKKADGTGNDVSPDAAESPTSTKRTSSRKSTKAAKSPPAVPEIPEPAVEWGSPVLSQPAAATYTMITEHSYTDVREVMVDLGITAHDTALRHLLTLYDWGLVDEGTLLQLHYLDQGPPRGLTRAAIEEALAQAKASKGVKKDDAVVQLLFQQHGQELRAQEQERKDITKYQVALVKQLIKRQQAKAAQGATAQDQSASPPSSLEAQMQFRMGKADLNRLKGYLTGRTLEEICKPPYSRKDVSRSAALQTLVSACKEGVQMPVDRLLADFSIASDPSAGVTALEIGTVLGRMLHMLHDGMQGRPFYDASRSELLKHTSTAAKVRRQESTDPLGRDLTYQQLRLVYYLTTAEVLDKSPEWQAVEERLLAAGADSGPH